MSSLFGIQRPLIAMLHVAPCPGVEGFPGMMAAAELLRRDLVAYLSAGVDGLLLENMHDFPCIPEEQMGPEVAAYLTHLAVVARTFCDEFRGGAARPLPIGVQVLFAANRTALAIAQAAGLQFIRAEGWTYSHVSDKGFLDAQGGRVKRYQHHIGADDILVFTDIKKKHASHALTADVGIGEMAGLMELHRSDGIIITGRVTGDPPALEDIAAARNATRLPLLIGSGLDARNLADHFPVADAFIVGSAFKRDGKWQEAVDIDRVRAFMDELRRLRSR